jgi:hypothetical protein
MTSPASKKADRLFVQNGRRLSRRKFSTTESRLGILIVIALGAILGWIAWKGAHPDPSLFALDIDLSQPAATQIADRGPVPVELASAGWTEGTISQFDNDNLYVKINGREGYYKSFGFERLYFLSILLTENGQTAVDIELYDLGNGANAVGAYSGERSPDAVPRASEAGLTHIDRNALYLTQGRYYLRAIGSDESPEVRSQLEHLQRRFESELPGEALPWGFALFVGRLGMNPGAVSYAPENAFSFGFARNVYSASLEDDAELFVTPASDESAASELADRYVDGFLQYGAREGDLIKDRYLGTYATVTASGPWVVGIRRAIDIDAARQAVAELANVVKELPLPPESTEPPMKESVEEEYDADAY